MPGIVFRDGGGFCVTETARLAGVERSGGVERAKLALNRHLGEVRFPGLIRSPATLLEALRAPERDAWRAVTEPARVRLEVTGLAGEGELVFDALAGRLVSYRMLETSGLDATLVTLEEGAPLRALEEETIHWTVTVRYEVERVD